ncbi:flagellar filament capping protein FliD [bacterium]|nr:flagellar filament capping protein FliD [bacterium]
MASEVLFSGLASGIDTESIITKMMYLEERPKLKLEQKSMILNQQKSIYSALNAKISALQDMVGKFNDIADPFFSQKAVSSSDTAIADATVYGINPATGSFQITVTQMATAAMVNAVESLYTGADNEDQPAQMVSSAGINAPSFTVDQTLSLASQSGNFATAPGTSGTIEINGVSIDWDDSMSLNEIIGVINNSSAEVTAGFDSVSQTFTIASNEANGDVEMTIAQTSGTFWESMNITPGTAVGSDAVKPDLREPLGDAAANLDIAVTSGTFTLNGVMFTIDATTDTLQDVLSRISSSSAGVTASYDENTGKVSLFQKETGNGNEIVLGSADDSSNVLYALKLSANNPPTGGAADTYQGTDAIINLNGSADQTFATNQIQGLIPGVTLNLSSIGNTTVKVESDVDAMVNTVKDFVAEYNSVMSYINAKLGEERVENPQSAAEYTQGTFVSDSLFLDAKFELGNIITSAVDGLSGDMNQLAQIGLTTTSTNFGKDATLNVDEDELRAALLNDPDKVEALFNSASTGIMVRLDEELTSMTDTVFGSFTLEEDAIDTEVDYLSKRIEDMEFRLEKREEVMRRQFSAMELAVAQLNSMGNTLAAMMGNMG